MKVTIVFYFIVPIWELLILDSLFVYVRPKKKNNNKKILQGLWTERVINHFITLKKRVTMRLSSMGFQHFYKLFFYAYMHLYKELSNQLFCS